MKVSSLAQCLEEFDATTLVMDAPKENAPRMAVSYTHLRAHET